MTIRSQSTAHGNEDYDNEVRDPSVGSIQFGASGQQPHRTNSVGG